MWCGHCYLCVVGGLPSPSRRGGFMHPARDENVVKACGWLEGTGRCPFCATTDWTWYDRGVCWSQGWPRLGWWLVGRGGWVVVLHFSSFFSSPFFPPWGCVWLVGWLGSDEGFPGARGCEWRDIWVWGLRCFWAVNGFEGECCASWRSWVGSLG